MNQTTIIIFFQVRNDYLKKNFESLDLDTAIQLCCIEIRRFFKDMPQIALDKKSNFEYLEKEVGLNKFLPKNVINTNKPKPLRKLIQQHFKKYAVLGDLECMFKFFEILKSVYRFDQERYRCALGVSWKINGHHKFLSPINKFWFVVSKNHYPYNFSATDWTNW